MEREESGRTATPLETVTDGRAKLRGAVKEEGYGAGGNCGGAACQAIVAVNVSEPPKVAGLAEAETVVVVINGALPTASVVAADVLAV